jgi:hypothetical protein
MAKNFENFRDELVKFANVVEIIEDTFLGNDSLEVIGYLDENVYEQLSKELDTNQKNKCVISIGNVNFTFLKK